MVATSDINELLANTDLLHNSEGYRLRSFTSYYSKHLPTEVTNRGRMGGKKQKATLPGESSPCLILTLCLCTRPWPSHCTRRQHHTVTHERKQSSPTSVPGHNYVISEQVSWSKAWSFRAVDPHDSETSASSQGIYSLSAPSRQGSLQRPLCRKWPYEERLS